MTNETNPLTQQAVLLTPEDHQAFNALAIAFRAELHPIGPVEHAFCTQIVLAVWNLERANRLEAALASTNATDPLLAPDTKTLDRIAAFRMRAERSFHKSLKELKAYQLELQSHQPLNSSSQNKAKSKMQNEPKRLAFPSRQSPQTPAIPQRDRDELCPCHSGRKYKNCCLKNKPNRHKMPAAENAQVSPISQAVCS